jgi:hypothetical protein
LKIKTVMIIICAAVIVGAFEIALHWVLGQDLFPSLTAIYLRTEFPSGKQFFGGTLDNTMPAAVLGWIVGWVCSFVWPWRKVAFVCIGPAVFIALLQPWYGYLIGWHRFFPRAGNAEEAFRLWHYTYLSCTFTAYLICLFFAKLAYDGRRKLARSKSNGGSQ